MVSDRFVVLHVLGWDGWVAEGTNMSGDRCVLFSTCFIVIAIAVVD